MADRLALVIGATGGVGGALADRLVSEGWRVRALNRDPEGARRRSGRTDLEWVAGDAVNAADVVAAAGGAEVIVHGANPPGYRNWAGLQLPMLAGTIAAARASGARILFPGNVYNYGEDAFPRIDERSEQNPATRKGRIRVAMEAMLRQAGVPVLILRSGDFFGPRPGANWLSQGLVRPERPVAGVLYPGPLEVPHAWAYLPDVAETFVRLLATDLAPFEVFQMQGHEVTGHELVAGLEAASGRRLPVSRLPWLGVTVAAPFNETLREMLEMRYLWQRPVLLDNARLVAALGCEPRTPLVAALRAALEGQGSLPSLYGRGQAARPASVGASGA
jgi:nucleoside-diphosphate-sugar epimerase